MGSFPTRFSIVTEEPDVSACKADLLVLPVYQAEEASHAASEKAGEKEKRAKSRIKKRESSRLHWTSLHQSIDKATAGALKSALDEENFKGECGKKRIFKVRKEDKLAARWIVVLGLGIPGRLNTRKAISAFHAGLKETYGFENIHEATILLPSDGVSRLAPAEYVRAAVFASVQSTYKTEEAGKEKLPKLRQVNLVIPGAELRPMEKEATAAGIMAMAEAFAKDLANMPANLKRAESLAQAARSLEELPGVSVEVISDSKRIQTEMPAFWAVAQGAAKVDPPRFIKVTYAPSGGRKPKKSIALVGKGVIFDTGGVQVKTGNGMNDMKFDMTGAASVLAALKAAAELGLKGLRISAYIAATRNLVGEKAYLPDSIIQSASGKRIEIRHTDAEGRVTLADAVYKAVQERPDEMLTVATLTGAAGIAVGHCIALMGTDDGLLDRIEQGSKSAGEAIQKLEFMEEDFEGIKSDRDAADLSNTAKGRNRGHMTAGAFVVSFADKVPVAHLDIAGGDAKDGNATGIAVKGIIEYLRREAS